VEAGRAKEMGLTNFTLPKEELRALSTSFARELAENAPSAVPGTKRAIAKLLGYQKPFPLHKEGI
jgi:enoyl-CoA hydratase/carnithine racemase